MLKILLLLQDLKYMQHNDNVEIFVNPILFLFFLVISIIFASLSFIIPIKWFVIFKLFTILIIAFLIIIALWGKGRYKILLLIKWIVIAKIPNVLIDVYMFIVKEILEFEIWK